MGKKAHPLAARIKRIMQKDEDVGKIAQATPLMIARAMEVFLQKLCENTNKVAAARSAKAVTTSHLKAYVMSDPLMDFMKDIVASAPDLPAEDEEQPAQPKLKRQRTADNSGSKRGGAGSKAAKTEAAVKREPQVKPDATAESLPATAKAEVTDDVIRRTSSSGDGAAAAGAASAPAVGRTATATLSSAAPTGAGAGVDGRQPHAAAGSGGLVGLQAAHPLLGGLAGRSFGRPGGFGGSSKAATAGSKRPPQTEARSSSSGAAKEGASEEVAGAQLAAAAAGPFGQQASEPLPGEEPAAATGDADMQEAELTGTAADAGMPMAGVLNLASFASYGSIRDDQYDDDYDS